MQKKTAIAVFFYVNYLNENYHKKESIIYR